MRDITFRAIRSIKETEATDNGFIFKDEEGHTLNAEVKETESCITVRFNADGKKCFFRKSWDSFPSNGWFLFWMSGLGYRAVDKLYN